MTNAIATLRTWLVIFAVTFVSVIMFQVGEARAFESCEFDPCTSGGECGEDCCACEGATPHTYGWCELCV